MAGESESQSISRLRFITENSITRARRRKEERAKTGGMLSSIFFRSLCARRLSRSTAGQRGEGRPCVASCLVVRIRILLNSKLFEAVQVSRSLTSPGERSSDPTTLCVQTPAGRSSSSSLVGSFHLICGLIILRNELTERTLAPALVFPLNDSA